MMDVEYDEFNLTEFVLWVERGYPHLLELIPEVQFCLGYYSYKDIFKDDRNDPRLWDAIASLRGVKRLVLAGGSTYFPEEEQILLEIFSTVLPNVSGFYARSPVCSMPSISRFARLENLEFSGRTPSTPDETLSVLKSLQSLTSIWLRAEVADEYYPPEESQISFTPEVLAQLSPLTSFNITQLDPFKFSNYKFAKAPLSADKWPLLTTLMIQSLRAHLPSLRSLYIDCQYAEPPGGLLLEVLSFVSSSQLTNLLIISKVSDDFKDTDFRSFLPKVTADRMVKCKVKMESARYDEHCKLLTIMWTSVPKSHGYDVELEDESGLIDQAGVLESESESEEVAGEESEEKSGEE
jgi:hypothetical protein